MKKIILTLIVISIAFASQNLQAQCTSNSSHHETSKDLVGVAASNHNFSTLVAAVKAADLVSALQGDGPFTIFAPTNDAFAQIDASTLNSLLEKKNKSKLTSILTYHVVKGKLAAKDVVAALKKGNGEVTLTTLNGAKLKVVKKLVRGRLSCAMG